MNKPVGLKMIKQLEPKLDGLRESYNYNDP